MSLLDQVTPETPAEKTDELTEGKSTEVQNSEATTETQPETSLDWYYDSEVKGNGNRPEWLKPKYKTMADQAKAYTELEKKLGAFTGAPEDYDLTLKDNPDIKFTTDDPLIDKFVKFAKTSNMSQEHVSSLMEIYAEAMTANIPDAAKEIESLGVNAKQDLQILNNWASSNLSTDEYNVFKGLVTTASAFRVFDKLRQVSTQNIIQPGSTKTARETKEQVLKDIHDPRYETDERFREDVRKRLSAAIG